MAIDAILAMTAAEIRADAGLPPRIGWFSCHFSPCGTGLSNLPDTLPPDSMLILDDFLPFQNHDPHRIIRQLEEVITAQQCSSLLLDFQRESVDTAALVQEIVRALPCPVGVSDRFADGLDCPVFLPPIPPDTPSEKYLKPWSRREIWLEAALDGSILTLTEEGISTAPLPLYEIPRGDHRDEALHCHYSISLTEDRAEFTLFRTPEDLDALLSEAKTLGVSKAIGLWQELRDIWIIV